MALIRGNSGANTLNGTEDDDIIYGFGGTDTINGGGGDDLIIAGPGGSDMIDGGTGFDQLILSGAFADYALSFDAIAFTATLGATVETIRNVESVVFDDRIVILVGGASGLTSINAAIAMAGAGDTILIAAGTYTEQVEVTGKSDLLIMALPGASVTIKAPADVVQTTTDSFGYAINSVVTVENSSNIVFQNITVDGDGRGGTVDTGPNGETADFEGVTYRNASGSLIDVNITGVRDEPLNGVQRGFGLVVDNDIAQLDFTMTGGSITDFQKNAAFINNANLDITGVTATGMGPSQVIGQNGWQIGASTGIFAGNTINGLGEAGVLDGSYATGIYLYDNVGLAVTNNVITGTNDVDTDSRVYGIYVDGTAEGGAIAGNTISFVDVGIQVQGDDDFPNGIVGLLVADNAITDIDDSDGETGGVIFAPNSDDTVAFTVEGSAGDDTLSGGAANDTLTGLGGDDTFDGQGGDDTTTGGAGDDSYTVDSVNDVVVELADEGTDSVLANVDDYVLADNVEALTLGKFVERGSGNAGDNTITGNFSDNTIDSGAGDDTVVGGGGIDTAVYSGSLSDYTLTLGASAITVSEGADSDTLTSIEVLSNNGQRYLVVGAGSDFTTIQSAVDAAVDGDIILVASGTYTEQVEIEGIDGLTIMALPGDTVTIKSPADVEQTATQSGSGRGIEAIVTVTGSTDVVLQNITVDGDGRGDSVTGGNDFTGVIYRNASGSLLDVDITGVRDATLSGNQRGVGLRVDNDTQMAFTMTGGSITDFQKNATRINGADLAISGVTITGDDASLVTAQNGLQVFNSTGSITGNTITQIGIAAVLDGSYATGMLLYGNTDLDVIGNTVTGSNDDTAASRVVGIYVLDFGTPNSGGTISGNTLSYLDTGIIVTGNVGPDPIAVFDNAVTSGDMTDPYYAGVEFDPNATSIPAFTVEGSDADDVLLGGVSNDVFDGLDGDDFIDGRGGDDTMSGGLGNDSYVVDSIDDMVVELDGNGVDSVLANVDGYTLADNVEVLTLGTGIASGNGNAGDNAIIGNASDNTISGGAGTDSIVGGGGIDTAVYTGSLGDYTLTLSASAITVGDGPSFDSLTSIEALDFNGQRYLVVGAGSDFTTIQSAVDAAADGDIILVASGTYAEQVTVAGKTGLTIMALPGDTVTIAAPLDLTQTTTLSDGRSIEAVVTVVNSTDVVFSNITVDGAQNGNAVTGGNDFVGVIYRNASGSLLDTDVTGVIDPSLSGAQRGRAIRVDNDATMGPLLGFTMTGGTIDDYQKNGIHVNRADVAISDVTIVGGGATSIIAQNGIVVFNSTGTIAGNDVSALGYTGSNATASAILLNGNTGLDVTGNTLDGSPASDATGIYLYGANSGGEVSGNTLTNFLDGIVVIDIIGPDAVAIENNSVTLVGDSGVDFDPATTVAVDIEGSESDDILSGGAANDILTALDGDDVLDGQGGDDTTTGGAGNDKYTIDSTADVVVELADEGTDSVLANVDAYTLAENVEALTLGMGIASGFGNSGANTIAGNASDNFIGGDGGDDTIDGAGGVDTVLIGGTYAGHGIDFAGGVITVTDTDLLDGNSGIDTLSDVETLEFLDRTVHIVDASGTYGAFTTIQSAVDAATAGDTIIVRAGTYTETVTVAKALTIEGAFAGSTGVGRTAASGAGETNLIGNITVSGSALVTIDGLRFQENNVGQNGYGQIHATAGNVAITNNVFYSTVVGGASEVRAIYVNPGIGNTATITDNLITGAFASGFSGASYQRGIWYDGAEGSSVVVEGNRIENARTGINADLYGTSTLNVSDTTFATNGTSVSIGIEADGLTLTNNTHIDTGTELNLQNITVPITYDAEDDIASVTVTTGTAYYNILSGSGSDTLFGTLGADVIDGSSLAPTGTGVDAIYGRAGDDILLGRGGDDLLNGGTGADQLFGDTGNDTYVIDDALDVITEAVDGGHDTVRTNLASYTLGSALEDLLYAGTAAFTGTGNALANIITGNTNADRLTGGDGNDTLNGRDGNDVLIGGVGIDTMIGGLGNDIYTLQDADVIVEGANGGTDTIRSSTSLTLVGYANIENGLLIGAANLNLTGSSQANILTGNDGENVITGGLGRDRMIGGLGVDTFDFNAVGESTVGANADRIDDFNVLEDVIDLFTIDARAGSAGNNAFTLLDPDAAFTAEGQIRVYQAGANTIVEVNTSGTTGAEMQIVLVNLDATTISDANFVF